MAVPHDWEESPSAAAFVGVLLVVMLVCLSVSWKSPEIIMFAALITVWNANIISTKDALSGFSNTGMLAVGALFVVVAGVEKSQLADKGARIVFGVETSMSSALLRMMILVFCLSAFFNNTPIVALFIPIVRDWCRTRGFSPSKFLMPLSFAVVSGGCVTMIGTSTNLVVNGILSDNDLENFSFFAPAAIALPAGILAIIYMYFVAPRVLPNRVGLFGYIRDRADELLTEIEIEKDFPYVGSTVQAALAKLELTPEAIIKIRRPAANNGGAPLSTAAGKGGSSGPSKASLWGKKRTESGNIKNEEHEASKYYFDESAGYADIYPVNIRTEIIQTGDVLFLSGPRNIMLKFYGATSQSKTKGLKFLESNPVDMVGTGTDFYEVVLGDHNVFCSRAVSDADFGAYYGCTVLAVRPRGGTDQPARGRAVEEKEGDVIDETSKAAADQKHREMDISTEVKLRALHAGDTLLLLAPTSWETKWARSSDFFVISQVGVLPGHTRYWDYIPLIFFAGMIAWVTAEYADMSRAAMSVGVLLCLGGWVSSRKAVQYVDWGLLLLIGSALGLSKAIVSSGLAAYVGDGIKDSGITPHGSIWLLYIFVMVMTEIVTNNAAAALAAPIAISIAEAQEVSYKPFAMVVLIAASTAYLTPIGYQTNLMVWAPGGYTFLDFARLGAGLNILYLVATCILTPLIFPF